MEFVQENANGQYCEAKSLAVRVALVTKVLKILDDLVEGGRLSGLTCSLESLPKPKR